MRASRRDRARGIERAPGAYRSADSALRLRIVLLGGVGVLLCGMLAIAALQLVMPAGFRNMWGVSPGVAHYRAVLPSIDLPKMVETAWVAWFRVALGVVWAAYAVVLFSAVKLRASIPKWLPYLVVLWVLVFAAVMAPSLSRDVYAYIGNGRMTVSYGLSPYRTSLAEFAKMGDEAARLAPFPVPTPYGPLWTAVSTGVAAVPGSLGVQVLLLKLLAAIALVALSMLGARIAGTFEPEMRIVAFTAIGLNPLLLIEGPGNAHNDILMMALLLGCVVLFRSGRPWFAYLMLGLSMAVKFVPIALLPWIVLEHVRTQPRRRRMATVVLAAVVALSPTLAGLAVADGLQPLVRALRWQYSGTWSTVGAVTGNSPGEGAIDPSGGRVPAPEGNWLPVAVLSLALAGAAVLLFRLRREDNPLVPGGAIVLAACAARSLSRTTLPVKVAVGLAVFGLLTYCVSRRWGSGAYLAGWSVLTTVAIAIAMPVTFPWYLSWPLSTSLSRWTRTHQGLTGGLAVLSALVMLGYATPV